MTDVEGEQRLDFINNMTSLIHGHAHPTIVEAVSKQLERGTAFAMPTEPEVELADLLVDRIDYIDKLRFCNSGSEAVMLCIKAARARTGKFKIAKIEGAYHGSYDYAQVSEVRQPQRLGRPRLPDQRVGAQRFAKGHRRSHCDALEQHRRLRLHHRTA